ncbi:NGG1p interacting factor NIF3 [Hydrogenovibrio sp. 3SP14C1]|nr:NGG1p interacting factor NIF3 [Hydrogenovibrio sp. 3SP14C1]MDG4813115.1 NGG1p interacting factor NIF3 [Hydrogenovibrio sp. 3SP14C1]
MYKFCFFVPESHLESVKSAVFEAGAGRIGHYDCCSWQIKGMGQFRALAGSQPYIGQQDSLEKVEEYRVEMVVEKIKIKAVMSAFLKAHPYEEPAFDVMALVDVDALVL